MENSQKLQNIVIIDTTLSKLGAFKKIGFNVHQGFVQDLLTKEWVGGNPVYPKPHYYVSPANCLLFMDGGIDKAYMDMFKNIESKVKEKVTRVGKLTKLGRPYLPIGSAFITDVSDQVSSKNYLISAPTMLMPQPVQNTKNAYWATKAVMEIWPKSGTLIIPPMCCGYGKMALEESAKQMYQAIMESREWYGKDVYISEPNMEEQPNYYENTEFKNIDSSKILFK